MNTLRLLLLALIAFAVPLRAQVPQLINYQGRIAIGGIGFDGTGQFKFAFVNGDGTQTFWSNDGTSANGVEPTASVSLPVSKGLYSVLLGNATVPNMTIVPATVFNNPDVWLRVWFSGGTGGFQLLSPDQRIAAVGYAMMAGNIADGAVTSTKLANGAVTANKLASNAVSDATIPAGANINAGKIGTGVVTTTEFNYLDGVTSALQAQLDGKLARTGGSVSGQVDFAYPGGTLSIRNEGFTPSVNLSGGPNAGILRLRNKIEIWPNDAGTSAGQLDLRNATGGATLALDGESGTANFGATTRQMVNLFNAEYGIGIQNFTQYFRTGGAFAWFKGGGHSDTPNDPGAGGTSLMTLDTNGNLNFNNRPGVEFASSVTALNCPVNTNTSISSVSVAVPAAGYIFLTATVDIGGPAVDYAFRLRDTTNAGSPATLISTLPLISQHNATLTYVVQVGTGGTKNFDAIIFPFGGAAIVGDRNITAVYLPVRY